MMPEAEVSNIVTCWLPLGDATLEMGCMQALPGVFNHGLSEPLQRRSGNRYDSA